MSLAGSPSCDQTRAMTRFAYTVPSARKVQARDPRRLPDTPPSLAIGGEIECPSQPKPRKSPFMPGNAKRAVEMFASRSAIRHAVP
jgi:hypothetical protein